MSDFNERTALNHRLHQDALTTKTRSRKARQNIEFRHRRAALRNAFRTVAIDAALIGAILASSVILLTCMVG